MTEPNANLDLHPDSESWKSEIASRLDSYRNRSKRKLSGDFSMRFDFEGAPVGPRQQICVPAVVTTDVPEAAEPTSETAAKDPVAADTTPEGPPSFAAASLEAEVGTDPSQPTPPERPKLRPSFPFKRKIFMEPNVIEFPRLFPPEPPPPYAVAEPVLPSIPRILDAPEIAQPLIETPILDGMRLDPIAAQPVQGFELPLQAASVQRRLLSALADALVVLAATGIFGFVSLRMLPALDLGMPLFGAALVVPVIFWAVYQLLFLVYTARTPGMALTQLAFSTFEGTAPNRRQRRRRLIGMAVSCSSLMLGFIWAFFDEDTLCWHDRISRTYTFQQKS